MTRVFTRAKKRAPTAYEILGCPPGSSVEILHAAYLGAAFELHPDRGGDEERFKAVALAWGQLRSKEARARYDAQLKLEGVLDCEACKGTGLRWTFGRGDAPCGACGGRGRKP